jgi:hypothetical protein
MLERSTAGVRSLSRETIGRLRDRSHYWLSGKVHNRQRPAGRPEHRLGDPSERQGGHDHLLRSFDGTRLCRGRFTTVQVEHWQLGSRAARVSGQPGSVGKIDAVRNQLPQRACWPRAGGDDAAHRAVGLVRGQRRPAHLCALCLGHLCRRGLHWAFLLMGLATGYRDAFPREGVCHTRKG